MATLPKSSTVVVHTVVDGKHSAMIFTEVDFSYEVTEVRSTFGNPMWREDANYVISGAEGYVFREGDDPTQVYVTALAHQAEETAEVRKERDEARRELSDLKARLRGVLDPPEPEDDHCHWCGGSCEEE